MQVRNILKNSSPNPARLTTLPLLLMMWRHIATRLIGWFL